MIKPQEFEELDQLIRSGQMNKAVSRLSEMTTASELTRKDRLPLAKLARRAFVPKLGLSLLRPFVRPSSKAPLVASDEEKIEYAACLSWIGALPECFSLLSEVDHAHFPDADFIQALAHIAEWDYAKAITLLSRYVQHPKVTDYWRRVGQVNLASALVHEELPAKELLNELEESTRKDGQQLLLANILQFKAEDAIQHEDWQTARQAIKLARELSKENANINTLFMEKWDAVITLAHDQKSGLMQLSKVRTRAQELGHWETVRDCDFHQAQRTKDLALATHLYFGTAYPAYREHLLKKCPWMKQSLPSAYEYRFDKKKKGLVMVPWEETREAMALQRMWETLASDFYRPLTLGHLHSKVFPWKHFDPRKSADSLHQALKRLREHFESQEFPLKIIEKESTYRLEATAPATIKVRLNLPEGDRTYSSLLEKVRAQFLQEDFSAQQVTECLELSRNMSLVYLRQWQKLGLIQRSGSGPLTRYKISESNRS